MTIPHGQVPYELEAANTTNDVLAFDRDRLSTLEKVNLGNMVVNFLRDGDEYGLDDVAISAIEALLLPECNEYLPNRIAPALSHRFDAIVAFCGINPIESEYKP